MTSGAGREPQAGGLGRGVAGMGVGGGGSGAPSPSRLLGGAFPSPRGQSLIPPTPPFPLLARGVPEALGLSCALCPATPTNLRRGAGRGGGGLSARLPASPPLNLGLRQRRWRPRRSRGAGRGRDCGDLVEGNGKRTPTVEGGLPHFPLRCPGLGREPGRGRAL